MMFYQEATKALFLALEPIPATRPFRMNIIEIKLHQKSKVMELAFEDGSVCRLSYEFLRVYSPSAEVRGHGSEPGIIQLNKDKVEIIELEAVGNYGVKPRFSDGHDTGIFTWSYLYELCMRQEELWGNYQQQLAALRNTNP